MNPLDMNFDSAVECTFVTRKQSNKRKEEKCTDISLEQWRKTNS